MARGGLDDWLNAPGEERDDALERPEEDCAGGRVKRLFSLGVVVATPGALSLLDRYPEAAANVLSRHQSGDWGEVCAEDARENKLSVREGFRILSVYQLDRTLADAAREPADPRARLWIITEADRSSTCLLLPSEY